MHFIVTKVLLYILSPEIIVKIATVTFTGWTFKINVKKLIFNTCGTYNWVKTEVQIYLVQYTYATWEENFLSSCFSVVEAVKGHNYSLLKKKEAVSCLSADTSLNCFIGHSKRWAWSYFHFLFLKNLQKVKIRIRADHIYIYVITYNIYICRDLHGDRCLHMARDINV